MPNQKRSIDDLNADHKIDDRWTESKLIAAGYEYHGDAGCKTCGDPITFYKKERGYNQKPHWLVLEEGNLAPHDCKGK